MLARRETRGVDRGTRSKAPRAARGENHGHFSTPVHTDGGISRPRVDREIGYDDDRIAVEAIRQRVPAAKRSHLGCDGARQAADR